MSKPKLMQTRLAQKLSAGGITQSQLARATKQRVTLINAHYLRGIKTVRVARRYAEILHCDWRELLD